MRILPMLFLCSVSMGIHAAENVVPEKKVEPAATEKSEKVPDAVVQAVKRLVRIDVSKITLNPAPLPNMYEAVIGSEVFYVSADGKYVVMGDIREAQTGNNLTENKREQLRRDTLSKVNEDDTVVFAPKDHTNFTISVFTDVDCPYCAKLHREVPKLNASGVKVRYLAFPRAGAGSETFKKMVSIWCSKDRQKALTDVKAGMDIPSASCENPVDAQYELGKTIGVSGTPAIVLPSGEILPGYMPAERLIAYLQQKSAPPVFPGLQIKP